MTLEQTVRANALFDVYGELLTASQRQVVASYIVDNESFGEIAASMQISRQAVADLVSRAISKLEYYEGKLHFVAKLTNALAKVEPLANSLSPDEALVRDITLTYTDLIKSLED